MNVRKFSRLFAILAVLFGSLSALSEEQVVRVLKHNKSGAFVVMTALSPKSPEEVADFDRVYFCTGKDLRLQALQDKMTNYLQITKKAGKKNLVFSIPSAKASERSHRSFLTTSQTGARWVIQCPDGNLCFEESDFLKQGLSDNWASYEKVVWPSYRKISHAFSFKVSGETNYLALDESSDGKGDTFLYVGRGEKPVAMELQSAQYYDARARAFFDGEIPRHNRLVARFLMRIGEEGKKGIIQIFETPEGELQIWGANSLITRNLQEMEDTSAVPALLGLPASDYIPIPYSHPCQLAILNP